jgi:DNA polymerase III subunit delta'
MGFEQFQGNSSLLDTIKNQLRGGRLPHSLLFAGCEGVGKRTLALFLAKAVNCQNTDGTDFCDHCTSCRKIEAAAHPDLREVEPDGQFIKIEQMRELSREVYFTPFEAKYRFFLINHAERLKMEAANSILKTLEEPPQTSHLILITPRPDELLGTIRSRCQIYRFSPLPIAAMEKLLRDKVQYSPEHRELLIRLCSGSIGKALQFNLDQYLEKRDELLVLLSYCLPDLSYTKVSRVLMPLSKTKDCFSDYLEILYSLLRDIFLIQIDRESPIITNQDVSSQLYTLASQVKMPALVAAIHVLDHLESGAKRNLNKALALDQFVFKLSSRV